MGALVVGSRLVMCSNREQVLIEALRSLGQDGHLVVLTLICDEIL